MNNKNIDDIINQFISKSNLTLFQRIRLRLSILFSDNLIYMSSSIYLKQHLNTINYILYLSAKISKMDFIVCTVSYTLYYEKGKLVKREKNK
jgi:hypothetical protein